MPHGIPERTPEDRASGVLRITIGNLTKRVPTLKLRAADEWAESASTLPDGDIAAGALEQARLEAVIAYDKTGALGGREYILEHADWDQIFIAFAQMMAVVRPFAIEQIEQGRALASLLDRAELLAQLSSTSGPSPDGDSTPTPSESDSTQSNSSTSGTPDKNESGEKPASE